jgi:hypothetical protein
MERSLMTKTHYNQPRERWRGKEERYRGDKGEKMRAVGLGGRQWLDDNKVVEDNKRAK